MGCTPSKSVVVYGQDSVCRDQDTGSTFVPSFISSASTPEKSSPRLCVDTNGEGGTRTFLSVPGRDVRGRLITVSPEPPGTSSGPSSLSFSTAEPRCPSPLMQSDTEDYGTVCTAATLWQLARLPSSRENTALSRRRGRLREMRSEKDQMTVAKDKSTVEIQFRDIPREKDNISANSKQKEEKKEIFTKVVIRRLPPGISKDQLEEQLSPLPSYDYFEFFSADQSLYPHLFSRAYINFKNPEDILHFRDRFDGYVFIDNKGLEYPAVVEFAPFQKISKKKLKKKDAKAGSIEEDPEYRRFLENYSCDEEKSMANPETLLGEIEAKTRELIAKRTTPLLEYIKNKKIEKQRIREEKREERRRRELEKKRQREEEKRKRREEERRKRKEAEKQKKLSEKDIKIKLLKKSDRDEDVDSDRTKDKSDMGETERCKWEKSGNQMKSKEFKENRGQPESDKEQQHSRRQRDKDHRAKDEERKRQRHHYEFDKFMRRKDETKWGKGYCQDREERRKKEGHHHSYTYCPDNGDKLSKEDRDDLGNRKERLRNKVSEKDRPAMQLYQPGARNRKRMSSSGKGYECIPAGHSPEPTTDHCYEAVNMGLDKGFEKSKEEQ